MAIHILPDWLGIGSIKSGAGVMAQETCPECQKEISYRAIKRHMVAKHGWRYRIYHGQEDEPLPVPSWYRERDDKGRFLKKAGN